MTRPSSTVTTPSEVPLQITVPPHVKQSLALKAIKTGRTRRALVLEGLRKIGVDVTDEDLAGRRAARKP